MQPQTAAQSGSAPGALPGLLSIFYSPGDTLNPAMKRPWLVPLVAAALLALILNVMIINVMGMGTIVRNQLEANPRLAEQLGPEGVNKAVQQAEQSNAQKVFAYVGAVVGVPVLMLIIAGVTLGVLMITGATTNYSAVLGAVAWSWYAMMVVQTLGSAVFLFAVDDFRGVDPQRLVMLNAGIFFDPETSSKPLRTLASGIDLIAFWAMYIQSVGLVQLSQRVTMKQAIAVVAGLYVIWTLGRAGWAYMF